MEIYLYPNINKDLLIRLYKGSVYKTVPSDNYDDLYEVNRMMNNVYRMISENDSFKLYHCITEDIIYGDHYLLESKSTCNVCMSFITTKEDDVTFTLYKDCIKADVTPGENRKWRFNKYTYDIYGLYGLKPLPRKDMSSLTTMIDNITTNPDTLDYSHEDRRYIYIHDSLDDSSYHINIYLKIQPSF